MSAVIGNPLLLGPEGYTISRSVRLRSSATAYFNRTPASNGSSTTFTISLWLKRGTLGVAQYFAAARLDANTLTRFSFDSADRLRAEGYVNPGINLDFISANVFRDPSAWYHIVIVADTGQATQANRFKFYVNNQLVTASSVTYPSQNASLGSWNTTQPHNIGAYNGSTSFDGYITEMYNIDGQALTPSSFGETDAVTGVWKPKKYAGTYGTNGFYLNFSDNSNNTAATIGKDYSGNGNNWTPNNISVTSGVTYDSMIDVPTMWADGGNGRGNYCTLNPLQPASTTVVVPTDGNLKMTGTASGNNVTGTMAIQASTYFEGTAITGGGTLQFGIRNLSTSNTYVYDSSGNKVLAGTSTAYGASFTTNDVIGIAVDPVNLTLQFFKNGTSQGTITSAFPSGDYVPFFYASNTNSSAANFGQRPFTYTPPSGFKALNTQNLPDSTIKKGNQYFDTLLWTSNASVKSVTGSAFQPDLVWVKDRQSASANEGYHHLVDSVRGAGKVLSSNATLAEYWSGTNQSVTAFNSNGFTTGIYDGLNGDSMVTWLWNAGSGSSSSNTSGSITSTVSVNATAGFSVVAYNSGASGDKTVGHGLGVAPSMIITKSRSSASYNWSIYHASVATTVKKYLAFTTDALQDNGTNIWGSAFPTSSVFGITSGNGVVASTDCIAYCFSAVRGYSAFGSYTGNGSSDGPFVFCGFRPRWIMTKRSDSISNWRIIDTARDTYNVASAQLYPDLANAEASGAMLDVVSNGFKIRNTDTGYNASGGTFIYAAFAENPFKLALAR